MSGKSSIEALPFPPGKHRHAQHAENPAETQARPRPAEGTPGQNALLAYILPGILNNLVSVAGLPGVLWLRGSGLPGAFNAAVLTMLVLVITWGATKIGVRLRL